MGFLNWKKDPARRRSIRIAGATHPGRTRDHNEDAFGIDEARACAVVADGMGGLARGEVASRVVVDSVLAAIARGDAAAAGLVEAHDRIQQMSAAAAGERMGSTAVTFVATGGTGVVTWVGDSRAYLWRGGRLGQLTKDHSFVQELIDAGAITADEAEVHPNRNVVTRAVGASASEYSAVEPAQMRVELRKGDLILLCTDGLSGYLTDAKIIEELRKGGSEREIADRLVARTLEDSEAGDNVTVVCAVATD